MSLSKTIFTGRKRISLILTLIFLTAALKAEPYRIGLVIDAEIPVPYVDAFESLLNFSARSVSNPDLIDAAHQRDEFNSVVSYMKALSSAARSERDRSSAVKDSVDKESSYEAEVINLDLSAEDVYYLSISDSVAIDYLKLLYDLDEIYYIRTREEFSLGDVEIYLDGRCLFRFVYSIYVETSAEAEILSYLLLRYRGSGYALVVLSGNVAASVMVDRRPAERYLSYIVLPFGMHRVEFISPSYEPYSMDIYIDEHIEHIEYDMRKVRTVPLFISTVPYTDEVYYQGQRVRAGFVDETTYPFSIIVNKEGFESRTIQSDRGEHSVMVTLLPSRLYDSERLSEKKNEFYTHLLITLLSFGSSVAIGVVSDIYETDLSPLTMAASGVSLLELIRTLTALFEYRDALEYGI